MDCKVEPFTWGRFSANTIKWDKNFQFILAADVLYDDSGNNFKSETIYSITQSAVHDTSMSKIPTYQDELTSKIAYSNYVFSHYFISMHFL